MVPHDPANRIVEGFPPGFGGRADAEDDFGIGVHFDQVVDEETCRGVDGGVDAGGFVKMVEQGAARGFVVFAV